MRSAVADCCHTMPHPNIERNPARMMSAVRDRRYSAAGVYVARGLTPFVTSCRANSTGEVQAHHARRGPGFSDRARFVEVSLGYHTPHGAVFSEVPDQSPSIDVGNDRHSIIRKEFRSLFNRAPVACQLAQLPDD